MSKKTENTDVRTEEQIEFANRVETITNDVRDYFKKFASEEFIAENDATERNEKLFEAFAKFKDDIDKKEYVIKGEALDGLKTILAEIFETLPKSVDETDRYIGLYDAIVGAKTEITFGQEQLQYIGEMFSKGSFVSIEDARKYKGVQDALRSTFNELFFNSKATQMAAQSVQSIEQSYKMIGLEKEEEIITEQA